MKEKCYLSVLKLLKFLLEVISRQNAACYLSNSQFKAHSGTSNFRHVYLLNKKKQKKHISLPNITWFAATYLDSLRRSVDSAWLKTKEDGGVIYQWLLSPNQWLKRSMKSQITPVCSADAAHRGLITPSLSAARPFSEAAPDWALCPWLCRPAAAPFASAGEVSRAAAQQNTLIISLNHCAVMGHRSCQLWWNETEDRKRACHRCGHAGRSCPSRHLRFLCILCIFP